MKDPSEKDFTATVIETAQWYGWKIIHVRALMNRRGEWSTPIQGDGEGFPDLFAVHPKYRWRLGAELKVNGKKPDAAQKEWLQWLELCGIPAYTWEPKDWEEIIRVLSEGPSDADT